MVSVVVGSLFVWFFSLNIRRYYVNIIYHTNIVSVCLYIIIFVPTHLYSVIDMCGKKHGRLWTLELNGFKQTEKKELLLEYLQ